MAEKFNSNLEVNTTKTEAAALYDRVMAELATEEKKGLILASLELIIKRQAA